MRSKPASEKSPQAGDAPDPVVASDAGGDGDGAKPDKARASRPSEPTAIELEVSRQRSLGWTVFGLIVGGLLIWKLGTVGVWGGVVLVAMGVYHAWNLAQTLLYPPGTIIVSDREVTLPRGLCVPRPVVVKPKDITAAYFLRRSVPWNHASPVLIVELGAKAMAFPRDWFASEADQRHVIHHLRALLPRTGSEPVEPVAKSDDEAAKA
ncbi:MAG: hypothetical protein ABIY55_21495 [Kofleriaceae bacterium]